MWLERWSGTDVVVSTEYPTRTFTRCPICGWWGRARTFEYCNAGPHEDPAFDALVLQRCEHCDSMWCPDSPSNDELADYYANRYSPARTAFMEKDEWPVWDTRAASLITLARMYTEWTPGDLFVDVGPGNGAALSLAPLMLPEARLGCVEFNERSIEYFRRHVPLMKVTQSLNEFDRSSAQVVYSAHSLEHHRPDDVLSALEGVRRVLVDGGVLALEVPLGLSARTIAAWRHTPHLLFFSPSGLHRLLSRAGLSVAMSCTARGRQAKLAIPQELTASLPRVLVNRLSALNTGDLTAAIPRRGRPIRGVIKVIAVNSERQGTRGRVESLRRTLAELRSRPTAG